LRFYRDFKAYLTSKNAITPRMKKLF